MEIVTRPMVYIMPCKEQILVIDAAVQELVEVHADALRELLTLNEIPVDSWNAIWSNLETDADWKEADEDLDIQWLVGWMKGVADVLKTTERKLVKL